MKTKNIYSLPLDLGTLWAPPTCVSPAHGKYFNEHHQAWLDYTRSVDFLCNIGTSIRSALGGEIFYIKNDVSPSASWGRFDTPPKGLDRAGNNIIIKHKNDEFSYYCHLAPGNFRIQEGDVVETGDILGSVGHTGWSINPHLHFMTYLYPGAVGSWDIESLEPRWDLGCSA